MRHFSKISLGCAVAALSVSSVQAAELPQPAASHAPAQYVTPTVLTDGAGEADHWRRYRYRRHQDRVDAGDVIAGALIIGSIFAIASAVSKNDRNDRDYVSNDDFDRAVDSCVNRIERDQRIGSVDNVGRTRNGYSVSGTLYSGAGFNCQVAGSGRVIDVDYGLGGVRYQSGGDAYGDPEYADPQYADPQYGDSQYSDDAYARARANTYSTPDRSQQPAYPGGPVEGDDGYGGEYYGAGGTPY